MKLLLLSFDLVFVLNAGAGGRLPSVGLWLLRDSPSRRASEDAVLPGVPGQPLRTRCRSARAAGRVTRGIAHEPPSRNRPERRRARGSPTRSGRRGRLRRAEPRPVRPAGASGPSAPRASWASRPRRWCAAPKTSCTTCTASPASCASGSWPRATSSTSWRTAGWCARRTTRRPSSEVSGRARQAPGLALAPPFSPAKWGQGHSGWGAEGSPPPAPARKRSLRGASVSAFPPGWSGEGSRVLPPRSRDRVGTTTLALGQRGSGVLAAASLGSAGRLVWTMGTITSGLNCRPKTLPEKTRPCPHPDNKGGERGFPAKAAAEPRLRPGPDASTPFSPFLPARASHETPLAPRPRRSVAGGSALGAPMSPRAEWGGSAGRPEKGAQTQGSPAMQRRRPRPSGRAPPSPPSSWRR